MSTIVLLHGLLCDETVWVDQQARLSAEHEVLVPSLRGYSSLTDMAASVVGDTPSSFHLIGHSMGGRVAFEIMRLAPERVASLVVLDTGTHPVSSAEPAKRQVLLDVAEREGIGGVAREWIPPMIHPDRRQDVELLERMHTMVTKYSVIDFQGQVGALLSRLDAGPVLATITCPTLVVCGRQDDWSPLAQHETIAAAIPGAELAVIDDAGHMVTVEQPQAVSALLEQWFDRLTTSPKGASE